MENNFVRINILDLFSGIGGFHLGIQQAGVKITNSFHADIDKYANEIYERNFTNSKRLEDVKSIKPISGKLEGKKIHLITFGFPCQDLSIAGKREGFRGNRSSLFFEAIRLIKELQPDFFIFENVKGFFSSNRGRDFTIALQTITDIGYDGQWQLINTAWFLPQNRERIYFVGNVRGKCRKQIFPLRESKEIHLARKRTEIQQANTLRARSYTSWRGAFLTQINKEKSQGYRVYNLNCSATIASQAGGMGAKTGLYAIPVLTPHRMKKRQNGRRFKNKESDSFTLTSQDIHGIYDGLNIRKLTPTECERLQGFPDDWTKGFSDTQRYKCLGNAVSVPIVKAIAERIYDENLTSSLEVKYA